MTALHSDFAVEALVFRTVIFSLRFHSKILELNSPQARQKEESLCVTVAHRALLALLSPR